MSYTKGDLVSSALEEIGIAEFEFDISPEQRQSAIRKMDMMMAEWGARKIRLFYPLTKSQTPDPDQETDVPDWAGEAIVTNLAVRIAPSYGKQVSPETKATARNAYTTLCGRFSSPVEMQLPSMPKGAGYKTTEFRYTVEPEDNVLKQVDESFDPSGGPTNEP
jgi:hypothetical protein